MKLKSVGGRGSVSGGSRRLTGRLDDDDGECGAEKLSSAKPSAHVELGQP